MEGAFDVIKTLIIAVAVVFVVFLILMAIPKSKLRDIVLEYLGWGTATVSGISVISPIDVIPDFIPIAGQLDDIGMIIFGLISGITAYRLRKKRLNSSDY